MLNATEEHMENIYLIQHGEVTGESGVYRGQIPAKKTGNGLQTQYFVLHATQLSIMYNPLWYSVQSYLTQNLQVQGNSINTPTEARIPARTLKEP